MDFTTGGKANPCHRLFKNGWSVQMFAFMAHIGLPPHLDRDRASYIGNFWWKIYHSDQVSVESFSFRMVTSLHLPLLSSSEPIFSCDDLVFSPCLYTSSSVIRQLILLLIILRLDTKNRVSRHRASCKVYFLNNYVFTT